MECDKTFESDAGSPKFGVIEFIKRGPRPFTRSMDIVPLSWLEYKSKTGTLTTQFFDGEITSKTSQIVQRIAKNCQDPPLEWPVYSVNIKARASKFRRLLNDAECSRQIFSRQKTEQDLTRDKCQFLTNTQFWTIWYWGRP